MLKGRKSMERSLSQTIQASMIEIGTGEALTLLTHNLGQKGNPDILDLTVWMHWQWHFT